MWYGTHHVHTQNWLSEVLLSTELSAMPGQRFPAACVSETASSVLLLL